VCTHRVTCLVWVSFAAPAFAYVQVHEASSVLHLVFIYDFKECGEVPADARLSLACSDKSSYRTLLYVCTILCIVMIRIHIAENVYENLRIRRNAIRRLS